MYLTGDFGDLPLDNDYVTYDFNQGTDLKRALPVKQMDKMKQGVLTTL